MLECISVESTALDATDFRILSLLDADGRMTFAALGTEVGLSPPGAADRVRRLLAGGVITGFTALVDQARIGRSLDAFIDVRLSAATRPERFEQGVLALDAVREVAFVTGRFDYQLRVACSDADDLDRTVRALRSEHGAAHTETRIVLRDAGR